MVTGAMNASYVRTDEGRAERLQRLFQSHQAKLYRLARRMMREPDEAKDLVQDTFVRAATSTVPIGDQAEEAWLVRVLVNLCRDRWRRRQVRDRARTRIELDSRSESDQQPDTESGVVAKVVVWQALRALSPRRRAVVILCDLDEQSVGDAARLLGISAVTVRWHLARGRRELATIVGEPHGSEVATNPAP